jgi:hypothetical protein
VQIISAAIKPVSARKKRAGLWVVVFIGSIC